MTRRPLTLLALLFLLTSVGGALADIDKPDPRDEQTRLTPLDVFQLEYAGDPRVSPDGSQIVYVRNSSRQPVRQPRGGSVALLDDERPSETD